MNSLMNVNININSRDFKLSIMWMINKLLTRAKDKQISQLKKES